MSSSIDRLGSQLAARAAIEKAYAQALRWPADQLGMPYQASAATQLTAKIPAGTQSLNVLTTTGFSTLAITGRTSSFPWASLSQYASTKSFSVPWNSPPDDEADFLIVTGAGQGGMLYATASPTPSPGIQGQSRGLAFSLQSRAVGVYNFDIPPQPGFKGIAVYMDIPVAAGTVQVGIFDISPSGSETSSHLNSGAIGVSSGSQFKVYPGIAAQTNVAASDLISQSPRIKATVAAGACTFRIDYDLIP